ncbi:hypothetical protein D3C81_2126510 [compost metagenome]
MEEIEEAPIEQVMIEATSAEWADAINSLTAIAALIGSKKMSIEQVQHGQAEKQLEYTKKWDWMTLEDQQHILHNRSLTKRDQLIDSTESDGNEGDEYDV